MPATSEGITNETERELLFPVPWGNIAAKSWNDPSGIPVILVHGLMENAGTWDQIVPLQPKSYYFVAIDLPGHGKSSHLPAGLTLKFFDFVLAIDNVVDQLNWEKCIFIGHSFGGILGYFYCAVFPKRVDRFLALDAEINMDNNSQCVDHIVGPCTALKELMQKTSGQPKYSFEQAVDQISSFRKEPTTNEAAKNLAKRCLIKSSGGYTFSMDPRLKFYEPARMSVEQGLELLRLIVCPVWVVGSSPSLVRNEDEWGPFELIKMLFKKTLGEYRVVPDEGSHRATLNFPDNVSKVIADFVSHRKSQL